MLKDRANKSNIFIIIIIFFASFANAEPEAIPGEFVVKLKSEYDLNLNSAKNIKYLSQNFRSYIKKSYPDQNIIVIKKPVFETTRSVLKSFSNNDLIELIEPNYIYRINKTPNDPFFEKLWGLNNVGQKDPSGSIGKPGYDIDVVRAWDINTGSENVVVAVIDTGINYKHPDLIDNLWTNELEKNGQPGVDDDGNGYIDDIHGWNAVNHSGDPLDDHGHGTHCAGTIGAYGDDGKGLVGVNWKVRMMGVKFLSADGSGSLDGAIEAIDYAIKNGAKILNNSWGGGGFSEILKQAVQRSHEAGTLFVAAAGNESNDNDKDPSYPASYDVENVLTVAAIDNNGVMASFSNFGRKSVHVGAPGVEIYSSISPNGYDSWSGTSMASPHVAGIAGLILANEPQLSGVEIKERIIKTAKPIAGLSRKVKTGGIVNAYNALTNTQSPADPNDPEFWSTLNYLVSTDHPYLAKYKKDFIINVSGVKEFSIYFEKFETEKLYDNVMIYDSKGKLIQTLSGNQDGTYSAVISGDTATIRFISDDSVQGYGFDITKIAFR